MSAKSISLMMLVAVLVMIALAREQSLLGRTQQLEYGVLTLAM